MGGPFPTTAAKKPPDERYKAAFPTTDVKTTASGVLHSACIRRWPKPYGENCSKTRFISHAQPGLARRSQPVPGNQIGHLGEIERQAEALSDWPHD